MDWTPSRVALAAITGGVVLAGVGAGILLQPGKEREPAEARGPGVSIAVVAPREPVPDPGGVMDVGDLTDGYTHREYAQPVVAYEAADAFEDDYPSAPPRLPERAERPREPAPEPPPVLAERRERPSRWPFGFDPYRTDAAEARREQRAMINDERRYEADRRAQRYEEREVYADPREHRGPEAWRDEDQRPRQRQWYSSDGRPVPGPG